MYTTVAAVAVGDVSVFGEADFEKPRFDNYFLMA
jgi:hypothetical protein